MAKKPVLSFGETLIDLIAADEANGLDEVDSFVVRPGGAPANVAVALARMGVPSAFCGVIGNDPFGRRLRRTLEADGVDCSRLRGTDDADTTIAFAWKDTRGDGHFRLLRMADVLLSDADVNAARIDACGAIVVGSVALSEEPSRGAITRAVETARGADVPVCFDINVRPTLWPDAEAARAACAPVFAGTTLLKLSLDDARFVFAPDIEPAEALERAVATGARFVVLTDGGRGAWFSTSGGSGFVPAFEVDAIEPTGAGDAFHAAVIARLEANGWSMLEESDIRFAAAAGALTTTRRGAIDSLPLKSDVERFLERAAPRG